MKNFVKSFVFTFLACVFLQNLSAQTPYLGQTPPGLIPQRFAPSNIQSNGVWFWRTAPAFAPDGTEMFFAKYHTDLPTGGHKLYVMSDINGTWTSPVQPSFSSGEDDFSPVYSNGGDTLYFSSTRDGSQKIYFAERTENGWSAAQLLDFPYQVGNGSFSWDLSLAQNGTIYFSVSENNLTNIYKSVPVDGQYLTAEILPAEINSPSHDNDAFIAPDESFIIFASNRPGGSGYHDLYISFQKPEGGWTQAQNMGTAINKSYEDAAPQLSPDGLYLFFTTVRSGDLGYNPYWVDADIIDQFNPFLGSNNIENNSEGLKISPNPCNRQTVISFELQNVAPISIEIYDSLGNKVLDIVNNQSYEIGFHQINADVSVLSAGTYNCVLFISNNKKLSTKIIIAE